VCQVSTARHAGPRTLRGEALGRYAPFATLAAVAALGGALFMVNSVNNPANVPVSITQDPGDPAAPSAPPPLAAPAPGAVNAPAPANAQDANSQNADTQNADTQNADPRDDANPGDGAAAPEPPAVDEKSYAGRSAGNEVTIAIAVKNGRAVGYVCDGEKIEAWFEGTLGGERLDLRGGDGSTITGTATPASTFGAVTIGRTSYPFSAAGVEAPAGLYEGNASVRGVTARLGWIVTADGSVTGVANMAGRRGPAPALDPAAPYLVEVDGVPVAVSVIDGGDAVIRR
jgi:hypothetical protein